MPADSATQRKPAVASYITELQRIAKVGERARAVIARRLGPARASRQAQLLKRLSQTAVELEQASADLPEEVVVAVSKEIRATPITKSIRRATAQPLRSTQNLDEQRATDEQEALLADALRRGQEYRATLLADERLMLSSDALAERLGTTRMTVNNRRDAGKLLALRNDANDYRYPAWQAEDAIRDRLPELLKALKGLDSWDRYRFFTTTAGFLGKTPLEALRAGEATKVLRAARGYAER